MLACSSSSPELEIHFTEPVRKEMNSPQVQNDPRYQGDPEGFFRNLIKKYAKIKGFKKQRVNVR